MAEPDESPCGPPQVSIVVPVYNEEDIVVDQLRAMLAELRRRQIAPVELLVVSNGSSDRTVERVRGADLAGVVLTELDRADYGHAMRTGLKAAAAPVAANVDIDYWDVGFLAAAMRLLEFDYDVVIATKNAALSRDTRPLGRRLVSRAFTFALRVLFGLKATDTHGMKVWRNDGAFRELVDACQCDRDMFDTELILRSQYAGRNLVELPVTVRELRTRSRRVLGRVPRTLAAMWRLRWALRRSAAATREGRT